MTEPITIFCDEDGKRLGDAPGILPITLYKGMTVVIHGLEGEFKVHDWSYHHGGADAGLRIILQKPGELHWA